MTSAEDAYALAALIAAGGGVLLAAGSFGLRGILGLVIFGLLVWLAMKLADARGGNDTATDILVTTVIGGIGLAYLRLGWLYRQRPATVRSSRQPQL